MDLRDIVGKFNEDFSKLGSDRSTGDFWNLSMTMQEYEIQLREYIQDTTRREIETIIKKLQSNAPLSGSDLDYIKLWIIGDAEYYVQLENNYQDWLDEIKRLGKEIRSTHSENPDFKTAAKLRALMLDGIRVLGSIVFYLQQKIGRAHV